MRILVAASREPFRAMDCGMSVLTAILLASVAVGLGGPVRLGAATVFLLSVPGWAITGFWTRAPLDVLVATTVGASLAICAVVATISLWLELWQPTLIFYALGVISGVVLLVRAWLAHDRAAYREQRQ